MIKNEKNVINPAESATSISLINEFVKKLKDEKEKFYFFDVPEEYRLHPLIVSTEREFGIRKSLRKGFDIIRNNFFVEELVLSKNRMGEIIKEVITTFFNDFSSYFEFLQGDIYENACYYDYEFSKEEIDKFSIIISKINQTALIDYTIDESFLIFSKEESEQYEIIEREKKILTKNLEKINACNNYEDFEKIFKELKITYSNKKLFDFYIFNFIFYNKERAFDIIMHFINNNRSLGLQKNLCLIYNPQKVLESYNTKFYTQQTANNNKKRLKNFINDLENGKIKFTTQSYFDKEIHYYIFHRKGQTEIKGEVYTIAEELRYFESFDELAKFLNNDLSACDLSAAMLPDLDLSKFKISKDTKLPIHYQKNFPYTLYKKYDKQNDCFTVEQSWINEYGKCINKNQHSFKYFFDFAYFLKNDLSNADLLFCDGLKNIKNFNELNLKDARLKSDVLDKIGFHYELFFNQSAQSFLPIKDNEVKTTEALNSEREIFMFDLRYQKIYYVSDLHLLHKLNDAKSKTLNDAIYNIQKIIDCLLNDINRWICRFEKNILLIGGDTASQLPLFELFIKLLRTSIDKKGVDLQVIFTLGNHELWDFAKIPFDKIVEQYKKIINDNKMYLLQNNIIFKYDWNNIEEISAEELKSISKNELLNKLKTARLILLGGLGFSGYNEKFNASQLIYRFTINRQEEIQECKKFEELYNIVCEKLPNKRIIIFTHMPQNDWCSCKKQHKGYIYVNGHTHKNYFYDDGDYRIYADNQIGYYQKSYRLKYFYLEDDYDLFENYKDGIYEISRDEYLNFYHGKNISVTFNREFYKLYMLKKSCYYMFLLQNSKGDLMILNGGNLKKLTCKSLSYYFNNMDKVITYIKSPLDDFSKYQKRIAHEIKSIGGDGTIHGAIIDIDFFNHIYINPIDLTITAYWASDMINKKIFKNVPSLLQHNCPTLFLNYLKIIENSSSLTIISHNKETNLSTSPLEQYLNTDIYKASRQIKKMQKLSSNILSLWVEPQIKSLTSNND